MADNTTLNSGTGGDTIATDDIAGIKHQRVKVQHGADGSATDVSTASPLPVDLRADNLAGNLDVNIAAQTADITIADGGNSITVDNTNIDNLNSSDFDTGAGTDTTPSIGIAVPANGGAAVITGDATNGLDVDVTRVSGTVTVDGSGVTQPVSGTITANAGTGTFTVGGVAAENAAVSGNPVLAGGRYDATPRTLGDGDVGAVALDVNGHTITSPHAATIALSDNVSNTVNLAVDEAEAFMGTATFGYQFDGSTWDRVRGDATNGLLVNLGTNNDVTLNANSGVDIGDVDVTSIIPGTGATNLGKAKDSASGSTDTGVAILAVRDDEQAAITPADGDYTTLTVDKYGKLKVSLHPDATSVPKRAVIDAATSGDNTLVAAAGAGIKIRVTSLFLVAAGTVNARFESGASGTALTGQMNLVANSGFTLPFNPDGWFETADNTLLNLELSAAISVDGALTYIEV